MAELFRDSMVILAPMVRIGTLPTRLLSLRFGADLVYSEELIDHRLVECKRVENCLLDTVDYVHSTGQCVFRTCKEERDRVILQIGTSDAMRALRTAKLVLVMTFSEQDVAGIDINMGCPKEFSLKGGMGAALLKDPEKIRDILTTLVKGLSIPVSCKIRILPSVEETLKLVKIIESTGVSALAVHGRYQQERSRDPVHIDVIQKIAQAVSIPVIANGGSSDITCFEDIQDFQKKTSCSSVMVARAAQWNPSVFRREGPLSIIDVAKDYLKVAIDYDNPGGNTKYCLAQIMHRHMETVEGRKLISSHSVQDMCEIWNLVPYYMEAIHVRTKKIEKLSIREIKELNLHSQLSCTSKRVKLDPEVTDDGTIELYLVYDRQVYSADSTPKTVLHDWARLSGLAPPLYQTIQRSKDKQFKSIVNIDSKKYSSSHWEKSKRYSEQAAALVVIHVLQIDNAK